MVNMRLDFIYVRFKNLYILLKYYLDFENNKNKLNKYNFIELKCE